MVEVERRVSLAGSAEDVWDAIGDFSDMSWHPAARDTDLEDRDGVVHRVVTLPDGSILVERLEDMDDSGKSYSYSIVEGPLPVSRYRSTLSIVANGKGCDVVWRCGFVARGMDDAAAREVVAGIYEAGINALTDRYG